MKEQEKKYLQLNDIAVYKASFQVSNYVWDIVVKFSSFEKDTIGKQFARAVDSISANIAESFGRYGKRDKIKFYRYSLGSAYECLDWNEKAKHRNIISEEQYDHIYGVLRTLPKEIHTLLKFTNDKLTE